MTFATDNRPVTPAPGAAMSGPEQVITEETQGLMDSLQVEGAAPDQQKPTGEFLQVAGLRRHMGRFISGQVKDALKSRPTPEPDGPTGQDIQTLHEQPAPVAPPAAPVRGLERLEQVLPPESRVANGQVPPSGTPYTDSKGGRFLDRNLEVKGKARIEGEDTVQNMWDDAVGETEGAEDALRAIAAKEGREGRPKELSFWNRALGLADRARYWYEISAEKFREILPDMDDGEMNTFVQLVAATSPLANPIDNMFRAVGVYSQHLRGVPITVDVTTPDTITQALSDQQLRGLKIGSFSGTFGHHLGINDTPSLSTNDRQVASSFGLTGEDIAANPALYEALSRFYMKMRDHLNAGGDPDAYQTWQLQALGWVQERIEKDAAKGKVSSSDDYVMALDRVVEKLEAAGVTVPDGKLTRDVLMDPRVAEVMSSTMEEMQKRPVATIETVTTQTPVGKEAIDLAVKAQAQNNVAATNAYDTIVQQSLSGLIGRRDDLGGVSVADKVVDAIIGKKSKLSRMEKGMGTFGGAITPNVRIPLPSGMTDNQRAAFLGIVGRGLRQDAAPASLFTAVGPRSQPAAGRVRTFSVFVPSFIDDDKMLAFQKALPPGHEISVRKVPNGIEIQVNPRFDADGNPVGPTSAEVRAAAKGTLPARKARIFHHDFKSDYFEQSDYAATIRSVKKDILDEAANSLASSFRNLADGSKPADPVAAARAFLRGGRLGPRARGNIGRAEKFRARYRERLGDLATAEKLTRKLASTQDKKNKAWIAKHGDKIRAAEGGL